MFIRLNPRSNTRFIYCKVNQASNVYPQKTICAGKAQRRPSGDIPSAVEADKWLQEVGNLRGGGIKSETNGWATTGCSVHLPWPLTSDRRLLLAISTVKISLSLTVAAAGEMKGPEVNLSPASCVPWPQNPWQGAAVLHPSLYRWCGRKGAISSLAVSAWWGCMVEVEKLKWNLSTSFFSLLFSYSYPNSLPPCSPLPCPPLPIYILIFSSYDSVYQRWLFQC